MRRYVSPDTYDFFKARKAELKAKYDAWSATYDAWKEANPDKAKILQDGIDGKTPSEAELLAAIPKGSGEAEAGLASFAIQPSTEDVAAAAAALAAPRRRRPVDGKLRGWGWTKALLVLVLTVAFIVTVLSVRSVLDVVRLFVTVPEWIRDHLASEDLAAATAVDRLLSHARQLAETGADMDAVIAEFELEEEEEMARLVAKESEIVDDERVVEEDVDVREEDVVEEEDAALPEISQSLRAMAAEIDTPERVRDYPVSSLDPVAEEFILPTPPKASKHDASERNLAAAFELA